MIVFIKDNSFAITTIILIESKIMTFQCYMIFSTNKKINIMVLKFIFFYSLTCKWQITSLITSLFSPSCIFIDIGPIDIYLIRFVARFWLTFTLNVISNKCYQIIHIWNIHIDKIISPSLLSATVITHSFLVSLKQ